MSLSFQLDRLVAKPSHCHYLKIVVVLQMLSYAVYVYVHSALVRH